jgi:hypothetical protein
MAMPGFFAVASWQIRIQVAADSEAELAPRITTVSRYRTYAETGGPGDPPGRRHRAGRGERDGGVPAGR